MRQSAVIDASVLVSAFLFPESVPGQVLRLADEGGFAMHVSPILIEETRRSLLNPRLQKAYGHDEAAVHAWCAGLARRASVFTGVLPEIGRVCRDADDDHVIAAAVGAQVSVIVTGDKDLLALGCFQRIRIVSSRSFLDEFASGAP